MWIITGRPDDNETQRLKEENEMLKALCESCKYDKANLVICHGAIESMKAKIESLKNVIESQKKVIANLQERQEVRKFSDGAIELLQTKVKSLKEEIGKKDQVIENLQEKLEQEGREFAELVDRLNATEKVRDEMAKEIARGKTSVKFLLEKIEKNKEITNERN